MQNITLFELFLAGQFLFLVAVGFLVWRVSQRLGQQDSQVLLEKILAQLGPLISEQSIRLQTLSSDLKNEQRLGREESAKLAKDSREELAANVRGFAQEQKVALAEFLQYQKLADESFVASTEKSFLSFGSGLDARMQKLEALLAERFVMMDYKQGELLSQTEAKLNSIRATVEEKLEKTLSERLGQSFETVGRQLIEVQKGLGEMQVLAQDVGGLKKVLSNVKMRGGLGEVQLALLLEQILAPEQFARNVKTKAGSNELVEFAIRLPGQSSSGDPVWLPIDAKFPKDVYESLQNAQEQGDLDLIERAQKDFDLTIKKMAKDIHEKYVDPPNTTDFAILFLPFEGMFAEVVRKPALLEDLQKNYKILVTGPTTLAAILNSLQVGFRTLAIEKRSSEVWQVLGAVKTEFEKFGGLVEKAQTSIRSGLSTLDEVVGTRTRAIQRRLREVESLTPSKQVPTKTIDSLGISDSVE